MIGGVHGKVLHIDLSTNSIQVERMPDDFYRLLIGGRAVVAYFLLRDLIPNTDPFNPSPFSTSTPLRLAAETPTATKRPKAYALRYWYNIRRSLTRPAVYRGVDSMCFASL